MKKFASAMLLLLILSCSENAPESDRVNKKTDTIPMAGNAFTTAGSQNIVSWQDGIIGWSDDQTEVSAYFYLSESVRIQIGVRGRSAEKSRIEIELNGMKRDIEIRSDEQMTVMAGEFEINHPGYNRAILRGVEREGSEFAQISDLVVVSPVNIQLRYVRDNENNRYYWGRRGPSVHLSFGEVPKNEDIDWFYSEVTVPEGYDPVGSYFMANGFGEGYFGIQVNSDEERRILFSVWSPYQTDNPDEIPEDQRIKVLDSGEDVVTGEFGNEGSGGQSYRVYHWKAGQTYRFLNSVQPDGEGNTIYTAYFYSPEISEWRLIARFLRPQTDTWYTRPHSFLENFSFENGYKERKAFYHNQWVRSAGGHWFELDQATFTGDDIAQTGYRTDFSGGAEYGRFFLKNGGFFNGETELNSYFTRTEQATPPDIDGSELLYFD